MEEGNDSQNLAFIGKINAHTEVRLVYHLAAESGHEITHAQSIKKVMGMIEWEERQYFLNQNTYSAMRIGGSTVGYE